MRDESTSEESIVLYRPPVRGIVAGLVGVLFVAIAINWSGDWDDGWLWLQFGLFGLLLMIGATVLIGFVGRTVVSEKHLRFQNTMFTFTSVEVGSIRGIRRGADVENFRQRAGDSTSSGRSRSPEPIDNCLLSSNGSLLL